MPIGLIDEQRGAGAWRDLRGDFGEMQVHRLDVAAGHDERRGLAVLRADRSEDAGRRPSPGDLFLLADTGLVGEPDL
jgi:hypothetical protein